MEPRPEAVENFNKAVDKLKIAREEWMLTEGLDLLSEEKLREACFWEYARESPALTSLKKELWNAGVAAMGDNAQQRDVFYFLCKVVKRALFSGNFLASRGVVPEEAEALKTIRSLAGSVQELLPTYDWRILLHPDFPGKPWSELGNPPLPGDVALDWSTPARSVFEDEKIMGVRTGTAIAPQIVTAWSDGIKTEGLLLEDSKFSRYYPDDAEIEFSCVLRPIVWIEGETPIQAASEFAQSFLALRVDPSPARWSISATRRSIKVLVDVMPGLQELFTERELNPTGSPYLGLFVPSRVLQGMTEDGLIESCRLEVSYFHNADQGKGWWQKSGIFSFDQKQCKQALKCLGARRLVQHFDFASYTFSPSVELGELWEREASLQPSFHRKDGLSRKGTTQRPIFSKPQGFLDAANETCSFFSRIFEKIDPLHRIRALPIKSPSRRRW